MKKFLRTVTVLLLTLSLFATVISCGSNTESEKTSDSVKESENASESEKESSGIKISFDKENYSVEINKTEAVKVTVTNYSGPVNFSTSDTGIISIRKVDNGNANVTGKKAGTGTIKVTAGTVTATCGVTVSEIDSVKLNYNRMSIFENSDGTDAPNTLTATYTSSAEGGSVAFTSSDTETVSISGVVNGVATLKGEKVGKATITATVGSAKESCEVEVTNKGIIYGIINQQMWVLGIKDGTDIKGEIYIPEVMWDSSSSTYQSVLGIQSSVFRNQTNATSLYVAYNVKCISAECFRNTGLTSVEFQMETSKESQIRTLGDYAFAETKLVSFVLPNTQDGYYFGRGLFYNCSKLVSAQLADAVSTIKEFTFVGTAIKTVYFGNLTETLDTSGNRVPAVYDNAFSSDCVLENVYYIGSKDNWNGVLTATTCKAVTDFNINDIYFGATGIGTGAKISV